MTGHLHDENPHAGQGSVLLDIGGDVGALVVEMPGHLVGEEVELRAATAGPLGHHPHVAVVARPVAGGLLPSLVFGEVVEGRYVLAEKHRRDAVMTVEVAGGRVTTVHWPG